MVYIVYITVNAAIRNEAFQVLQHMAKCLPVLRATIVEQFCRVTSSIPDIYPQLIRKSLSKVRPRVPF